jgi:hypothetical protein
MITTKIVFLSLLSVSWMSAVSAGPRRAAQMDIDTFVQRTIGDADWAPFFHLIDPEILETYFKNSIQRLKGAVDRFQVAVGIRANLDVQVPSIPGQHLTDHLGDLPRLVFLIRYSHLGFLLNIRPVLYDRPILAMITPDDVRCLSFLYRDVAQRPRLLSFEVYMVDLAVLLAMNNEMLGVIQNEFVLGRLERYGCMILSLYQTMETYMRLLTVDSYPSFVANMYNDIHALTGTRIHGYNNLTIQKKLRTLSDAILQVIAIYGSPTGQRGYQWISKIIERQAAIRHYLVYRPLYESDPRYSISDYLMNDLSTLLQQATDGNPAAGWYHGFLAMVNKMKGLVNGPGH